MKRMTKNEIIMIFLQQLEQNNILEGIRDNDEIVRKLDQIIRNITYDEPILNGQADFGLYIDGSGGRIRFDINKINEMALLNKLEIELITHELLHALFAEYKIENNKMYYKTGLQTVIIDLENGIQSKAYNKAITEGMTDSMAMKITGINSKGGYEEERELYKLCSIIIGEDVMLDKYSDDNISEYFCKNPYDIFLNEVIEKYGKQFGVPINDGIKRVLALSDKLIILKNNLANNKNSKKIYSEIKQEIHDEFVVLLEKIIDNEPDFYKKIDIMKKCIATSVGKEISKKVFNEVVENDNINIEKKIDIFHQIRDISGSYIDNSIIEKLLFERDDCNQFTSEEKLKEYIYLYQGFWDDKAYDTVFRLYTESESISQEIFDKKEMFRAIVPPMGIKSIEELNSAIDKTRYCKVGEYYLLHTDIIWTNGRMFDNNGACIDSLFFTVPQFLKEHLKEISEEKINDVLYENIISKCVVSEDKILTEVRCVGNMIGIKHENDEKFYSIASEGNLQEVMQGEERRIKNDMSDLDIELQKQTEDVSMLEIKEMIADMQLTQEETIMGEDENGREN